MYAINEATESPVPMKHPCLELIEPLGIGLFFVLTIRESLLASTTYPKHCVLIAIVCVAKRKVRVGIRPTEARGA